MAGCDNLAPTSAKKQVARDISKPDTRRKGGAIRSGVGGAKGRDQGECGPAKHAPDTAPGKRGTGAGMHTEKQPFAVPSHTRGGRRMGETIARGWLDGLL